MGGYPEDDPVLLVAWLGTASLVAVIAHRKGRLAAVWLVYGLLLPLIAFIHILGTWPDRDVLERRVRRSGKWQRCPSCAGLIPREAQVCDRCGGNVAAARARKRRLPPADPPAPRVS